MTDFVDPLEEPLDLDHGVPPVEEPEYDLHEVPEDSPEADERAATGEDDAGAIDRD
ncbi:hypothetical protein GE115_09225 [Agromyces sp. CFH 90414]|uniref:Uncharacterized protein n=1 Tax=Agromyces agglutinans TaxID=2662258 RepID=A0A6I2F622_9MICO|nr:hypothetical protein [Agromyces agglutinans]MRG60049.1 hypothetical protein [Agromyces agglutinans]